MFICMCACVCTYESVCYIVHRHATVSKENGGQVFEKEEGVVYGEVWKEKGERR